MAEGRSEEKHTFETDLLELRDTAVKVRDRDSGKTIWLPRSLIDHHERAIDGIGYEYVIPLWLAEEKGIV